MHIKSFAYLQGWRDLQVLTKDGEKKYTKEDIVYTQIKCEECGTKVCLAHGKLFCPHCGFSPGTNR